MLISCFVTCRSTVWHLQLVSCVLSIISHSHLWSRKRTEWFLSKKWWHCCSRAHSKTRPCNSASFCWSWSSSCEPGQGWKGSSAHILGHGPVFEFLLEFWGSFLKASLCVHHIVMGACLSRSVLALRPVLSNLIITHCVLLSLRKVGIVLRKAKHSLFSFNTACHSSLLNKCSGNAFPIATFLILMGFGNRSGFSLWSFTINLRQV